jgi:hypothetical protein
MFKKSHSPHTFVRVVAVSLPLPYDILTVEVHLHSDKILPVFQGTTRSDASQSLNNHSTTDVKR